MAAYSKLYLEDVVETQGKLFDLVAMNYPGCDTEHFITAYMNGKTRKSIDCAQAYVCTMDAQELWDYFQKNDGYNLVPGVSLQGFLPDWIGEFYAYYQWYYDIPSTVVLHNAPIPYLKKNYPGLHDVELELAVRKVGAPGNGNRLFS